MQENELGLKKKLQQGLHALGFFESSTLAQLWDYLLLLKKWNKVYNLTAIDSLDAMITQHILDSLAVCPHLPLQKHQRIIDVGTGAGLPGIPLALVFPEQSWTLLDSNSKKTAFLLQVKADLALTNVAVVHARIEDFEATPHYDGVISRAFTALDNFIAKTRHLLAQDGTWYALKGPLAAAELSALKGYNGQSYELEVPGLNARRVLIVVKKQ